MKLVFDLAGVVDTTTLGEATIQQMVRKGEFPQPRELSPRRVGWLVSEVEEWVRNRPVSSMLPPANTGHTNRPGRKAKDPASSN
ncbi:MAG TPA: AlpA family phage regulatory protein [Telluria sp.]